MVCLLAYFWVVLSLIRDHYLLLIHSYPCFCPYSRGFIRTLTIYQNGSLGFSISHPFDMVFKLSLKMRSRDTFKNTWVELYFRSLVSSRSTNSFRSGISIVKFVVFMVAEEQNWMILIYFYCIKNTWILYWILLIEVSHEQNFSSTDSIPIDGNRNGRKRRDGKRQLRSRRWQCY